jgi:toxin ParE1/3/4
VKPEVIEAVDWYAERSTIAATYLEEEQARAEHEVARSPQTWGRYLHDTRRYRLSGFPYALVYVERPESIVVIAVAHLRRRPGYWRRRLDP